VETGQLTTFDNIQRSYQPNTLHDMEASGFYETAIRFSIAELTHSIKIISDNRCNTVESIDKSLVAELIAGNITQISSFSGHLCQLARDIQPMVPSALVDRYQRHWKFSVTQKHQLQRLLQRRLTLGLDSTRPSIAAPLPEEVSILRNSKAVLQWLKNDTNTKAGFF